MSRGSEYQASLTAADFLLKNWRLPDWHCIGLVQKRQELTDYNKERSRSNDTMYDRKERKGGCEKLSKKEYTFSTEHSNILEYYYRYLNRSFKCTGEHVSLDK
jgi:hypothetical protein